MTASTLIDGQQPEITTASFKLDKQLEIFAMKWSMIFLGMWLALFFLSKYLMPLPQRWNIKKPFDAMIIRHRAISALHGFAAICLSGYYGLYELNFTCGKQNTYTETFVVAHTGAFLLADFIYMLVNGFLDIGNLVHHMLGIVSYSYAFYTQKDLCYLAFHLFPGEISNIQMNLREIFRKIGMRYTKTYFHNEFQYLTIYLLARMFWIPSIFYFIFTCPDAGIVIKILYPIHCLQSFYYCMQMLTLLRQRYAELQKLNKLGMKMNWFVGLSETELEKVGIKHYSNFKA
eukprot:403340875